MRIDVVGKHMDVTEAIRAFIQTKVEKLPRHYANILQVVVRVEQDPRAHGFHVEIVCDVEKHDDFVANVHDGDMYKAVDEAVSKVSRQLTAFKEKLKGG